MGLFDDEDLLEIESLIEEANRFQPQELCETNVQTIFNRCLERTSTKKTAIGLLFPTTTGYAFEVDLGVIFDEELILKNKRNIEYLFGQLKIVHDGQDNYQYRHSEKDFSLSYRGAVWTEERHFLLQLLYLGSTTETQLISLFRKLDETTTLIGPIAPTLSPKDPAFPAWWEQHKSEWEDKT